MQNLPATQPNGKILVMDTYLATAGTTPPIRYTVELDPEMVRAMIFKALRNKGKRAVAGPVTVKVQK